MLILRENVHLLWALLSCIGISFFSALFISECKITGFMLSVCEGRLVFMPERSFLYVRKIQLSAGSIQGDRQIVAEVQTRFGASSIHTGEIFPTNAAPFCFLMDKKWPPSR